MPQAPQLFESDAVFTHSEPQSICPEAQLLLRLPPVPALPLVDGLAQAAAKIAKQSPRSEMCSVFIVNRG
jgi:hypothetical protein